jgi:hydroxyethylthiazole kinase
MLDAIQSSLRNIKERQPLVLCLTNYVTMDFMANSLLAIGAAPLMSEDMREIDELVSISQAVYINLGTLNDAFLQRSRLAAQIARQQQIPVILDPVGCGASRLRTQAAQQLLPFADITRGNASEIIALNHCIAQSKGVETMHSVEAAMDTAQQLAQHNDKVIAISGAEDFICQNDKTCHVPFGSPLMPLVTGMGCTLTAIIAAFSSCESDFFKASCTAITYFGLCGQLTAEKTRWPGSFKEQFINHLFEPDWDFVRKNLIKFKACGA